MNDPVVVAALAGAGGVVAGSLISSVGIVVRERTIGRREREAREALRLQQLGDERAAFQRDTIVALQDSVAELWRVVAKEHDAALAYEARTGNLPMRSLGTPVPVGFNQAYGRVNMLRARVFDDELRRIVKELQEAATGAILTSNADKVWERLQAAGDLTTQMHERVNVLLKELF